MRLTFKFLYDDKWAIFPKPTCKWEHSRIILASGFQPRLGESYKCAIQSTAGIFVYQNKEYNLSLAKLANEASLIDEIEYKYEKNKDLKNPVAENLVDELDGLKKILPQSHEIVTLLVQPDRKNGGLMFTPQYLKTDPHADGKPSMRFFLNHAVKLEEGRTYVARIKYIKKTGKVTKKGAVILTAKVEIIK